MKILLALVTVVLFLGCAPATTAPTASTATPDIVGVITSVSALRGSEAVAVIVIEATPGQESGSAKDAVTIVQSTEITRRVDGKEEPADSTAIYVTGTRVEAYYKGAIRESYPRQATAARIVILQP